MKMRFEDSVMNDHDEQKPKHKTYETEWSFSVDNVGEALGGLLNRVGIGADEDIKNAYYTDEIEDAESVSVLLEPTIGEATVRALSDSNNLIEARVCYIGKMRFVVETEDTHKRIHLHQITQNPLKNTLGSLTRQGELFWDVNLSPDLPLDLKINSGMTRNQFDLRQLQLRSLKLNAGTGKTELFLPTMGESYPCIVNSGAGELEIHTDPGAALNLKVSMGTGRLQLHLQENLQADIAISGGVGSCEVIVPPGAAIRLKATHGIGKVDVPDWLQRGAVTSFIATNGTWQTANYDSAEQRITLHYEGGVGAFRLVERPT